MDYYIIKDCIKKPDLVGKGYRGREIYQKKLNGYDLRVIAEGKEIKTIITTYKVRSGRYGI